MTAFLFFVIDFIDLNLNFSFYFLVFFILFLFFIFHFNKIEKDLEGEGSILQNFMSVLSLWIPRFSMENFIEFVFLEIVDNILNLGIDDNGKYFFFNFTCNT